MKTNLITVAIISGLAACAPNKSNEEADTETPGIELAPDKGSGNSRKIEDGESATVDREKQRTPTPTAAKEKDARRLQDAVDAGDLKRVNAILAQETSANMTGSDGMTLAAHTASRFGHLEILRVLINAGAEVDSLTLDELVMSASPELLNILIENGANVDGSLGRRGIRQAGPLHWATFAGRSKTVALLLSKGAQTNPPELTTAESPLHVAASGFFADMKSPEEVTPEIRLQIAEQLIAKGADVNALSGAKGADGWTPLIGAAMSGHAEMTKLLLEKGANVHATELERGQQGPGQTALHFASSYGHVEVVEILLKRNARVNAITGEAERESLSQKTPLDLANDEKVRSKLIEHGGKSGKYLATVQ